MDYRCESYVVVGYFAVYMVYLFVHPESEFEHWLTLVAVPFALLFAFQRRKMPGWSLGRTLASVGFRRGNLTSGVAWAIPLGLVLSGLQLAVSRNRVEFLEIVSSGRVLYLFPLLFVFLLFTAGFTEEFFFRGVVQTRLARSLRSNLAAIAVVSFLFGLYHVPYAYLNPNWPSHGDLQAAIIAAFTQGIAGGLVLGIVYWRSRENLIAPILVHTLINVFPGMTQIRFG